MSSKKKEAMRLRKYRKAQRDYVRGLEARVLQQDADLSLLRAMFGKVEDGVPNPSEHELLEARIESEAKRQDALEAWLARLEEKAEQMAALNARLKASLAVEQQRNTSLEAENVLIQTDLARLEVMMDSMLREGDLNA